MAHYGKSSISDFQELFASINKVFLMGVGLGAAPSFYGVLRLSRYFLISQDPKSLVVPHLVRQFVYTMFRCNNRASFHLWSKEKLVQDQKVSKYYENDCLQNFLLLFMSLLIILTFRLQFSLSF